jgi:hypothetical protein
MRRLFAAIGALLAFTAIARAEPPVAVVEDVQGKVTGAEFMDYVVPGQVIKLAAGGKIVLGYMKSCWRETISGIGTVIVGSEQSAVHLADFKTEKVACDPTQAQRIGKELGESAATVFRSLKDDPKKKGPPPLVVHGLSPIVSIPERGKLVVERLDVKGERYEVDLANAQPMGRRFYDLTKSNIALQPGGAYSIRLNSKFASFVVDPGATPGAGPVIGRLVTLQ